MRLKKVDQGSTPPSEPPVGASVEEGRFVNAQPAALGETIGITGDFNQWHAAGLELNRLEGPQDVAMVGIDLPVSPGFVRYRLLVDGIERLDPSNPQTGTGPDGRPCSVVEITSANAESTPCHQTATPSTS